MLSKGVFRNIKAAKWNEKSGPFREILANEASEAQRRAISAKARAVVS
jgi:hypothetical protein